MKITSKLKGSWKAIQITFMAAIIHLILVSSSVSHAQSLLIMSYDSIVIGDATQSSAIYAYASIKNNAQQPIDVKVKRIDGNYTPLTDFNAICWGICHSPETSVSTMSITIDAGGIDSLNFTGHVFPDRDGIPASGDITYVFFDENKPSDSVAMTVHYQVVLTSSISEENDHSFVSLYPNPARNIINLDFFGSSFKPLIFNLYSNNGELVFQEKIPGLNKTIALSLSNLTRGVYMYSVIEETRIRRSGKLILH